MVGRLCLSHLSELLCRLRTDLRLWWFGSMRPMAAQSLPGCRPPFLLRRPCCESMLEGWGCVGMEISPFTLVLCSPAVTSWNGRLDRAFHWRNRA